MRLTSKQKIELKNGKTTDYYGYKYEQAYQVIQKLGQLEDIEEEYNIDIVSAVILCKKVNEQKFVYTKESWGIDTIKIIDDLDVELFKHRLYSNSRGMYVSLDLNEYGITWALTKEELEK